MSKLRPWGCIISCVLTILLALILLVLSSIIIDETSYMSKLAREIYGLAIFSLVISLIGILLPIALIYVVTRQNSRLIMIFSISLIFIALLNVVCGIILATGRDVIIRNTYKNTVDIFGDYSDPTANDNTRKTVAKVQQSVQCCGIEEATYWSKSYADGKSTPDSCCKTMKPNCGNGTLITQDSIYLRGCAEPISVYLKERYSPLIALNFTMLIFALLSALLGLIFERYIRQQYQILI